MIHTRRRYSISDAASAEELARDLAEMSWTLCTGFRLGPWLLLNDAFSEDGAQEYAVIREETLEQVESITVSWMNEERLLAFLEGLLAGTEGVSMGRLERLRLEDPSEHRRLYCTLCA